MTKTKKLLIAAWICSVIGLSGAFLPLLQFSFNDYTVNLFGICEEFASRGRAMFDRFPPLGYATFAVMVIAAFCQVFYLIKAAKKDVDTKGAQRFSVIITIFAIAALAGYLLLVFSRSDYTLTVVPFLVLIAGVTYIVISGKIERYRRNSHE